MAINSKNKVPEFSIEQEQNEFAASTAVSYTHLRAHETGT